MIVKNDFCLKPYNTFGIEIRAKRCVQINFLDDLSELDRAVNLKEENLLILGEASNILFTDHFDGLVIMMQNRGKEIVFEDDNSVHLKVNAGEYWTSLVDYTVDKKWWGLENLSLIPGKVGAAPVQNIGAYGCEQKDSFLSLQAFDIKKSKLIEFSSEECHFAYRDSIFKNEYKNRFIIVSVTYKLSKIAKPILSYKVLGDAFKGQTISDISIYDIQKTVNNIRESKLPDPQLIKNAGSFFKNPVIDAAEATKLKLEYPDIAIYTISETKIKVAAGWLIEKAGWKGKSIGEAAVHEKQALVLINKGKATGSEILELSEQIQNSVLNKFGIQLEREVIVI